MSPLADAASVLCKSSNARLIFSLTEASVSIYFLMPDNLGRDLVFLERGEIVDLTREVGSLILMVIYERGIAPGWVCW